MAGMQMPSNTLLGIGIQYGPGSTDYDALANGYERPVLTDGDISYYPLTSSGFSIVKNTDRLPPMTGGPAFSIGSFTTGIWGEGPISTVANLHDRIGLWLLAALGDSTSVANTKIENLADPFGGNEGEDTGINSHVFTPYTGDQFFIPWVTLRRLLPHTTMNERPGEQYQDGRVRSLTLTANSGAPVNLDLDVVARTYQGDYVFLKGPDSWAENVEFDDFEDYAVTSCDGFFKIIKDDGEVVTLDVTSITLTITNNLLAPAQSVTIGTYSPTDFPMLTRDATISVTIMMKDYDLYVSHFAGTDLDFSAVSGGVNPSCTVYRAGVDAMFASQMPIGALCDPDEPYRLRFVSNPEANNVEWTIQPLRIDPSRPVILQATANLVAAPSGEAPLYVLLQNQRADYDIVNSAITVTVQSATDGSTSDPIEAENSGDLTITSISGSNFEAVAAGDAQDAEVYMYRGDVGWLQASSVTVASTQSITSAVLDLDTGYNGGAVPIGKYDLVIVNPSDNRGATLHDAIWVNKPATIDRPSIPYGSIYTANPSTAIDITGTGFRSGSTVWLERSGYEPIAAQTGYTIASLTSITGIQFDLAGAGLTADDVGYWKLVVKDGDGQKGYLHDGFIVSLYNAPQIDDASVTPSVSSNWTPSSAQAVTIPATDAAHGFRNGCTVRLTRDGEDDICATDITLSGGSPGEPYTQIDCVLDTSGCSGQTWSLEVINPDGQGDSVDVTFS